MPKLSGAACSTFKPHAFRAHKCLNCPFARDEHNEAALTTGSAPSSSSSSSRSSRASTVASPSRVEEARRLVAQSRTAPCASPLVVGSTTATATAKKSKGPAPVPKPRQPKLSAPAVLLNKLSKKAAPVTVEAAEKVEVIEAAENFEVIEAAEEAEIEAEEIAITTTTNTEEFSVISVVEVEQPTMQVVEVHRITQIEAQTAVLVSNNTITTDNAMDNTDNAPVATKKMSVVNTEAEAMEVYLERQASMAAQLLVKETLEHVMAVLAKEERQGQQQNDDNEMVDSELEEIDDMMEASDSSSNSSSRQSSPALEMESVSEQMAGLLDTLDNMDMLGEAELKGVAQHLHALSQQLTQALEQGDGEADDELRAALDEVESLSAQLFSASAEEQ